MTEQGIPVIRNEWICPLVGIFTPVIGRTVNYFNLAERTLRAGCAQQMMMEVFCFFFSFWQVNQDYMTISFLFNPNYYQSH